MTYCLIELADGLVQSFHPLGWLACEADLFESRPELGTGRTVAFTALHILPVSFEGLFVGSHRGRAVPCQGLLVNHTQIFMQRLFEL